MSKKAVVWGNTPFLVPRTEKVEGESWPFEGLHNDLVYLEPVLDKASKQGNRAYNDTSHEIYITEGYIKDNRIYFIPESPLSFHGTSFAFNRPKNEDESKQNELIKQWASNWFYCVLECKDHSHLKLITDKFDGMFCEGRLTILTVPGDLPENVTVKIKEQADRIREDGIGELDDPEFENNLFLETGLSYRTEPDYSDRKIRRLYSDPLVADCRPKGHPDLKGLAESFEPPKKSSNGSGKGRPSYSQVTPEQRLSFVTSQLGVSTVDEIVDKAEYDPKMWVKVQLVLACASEGYQPQWELPTCITEKSEVVTIPYENGKPKGDNATDQVANVTSGSTAYLDELQYLQENHADTYADINLSSFDLESLTEKQAELIYRLITEGNLNNTTKKHEANQILGTTLTKSRNLSRLNTDELRQLYSELVAS